ncbi:MAG: tRNA pseudouridine(55) synthase TruB [Oscillospiraceae bacterium]|jgi:tRNA pseudouridine55 synthase|nr:tRNA pseudouridine(55) synthase TruB [Oscillospiraceae bacterium]
MNGIIIIDKPTGWTSHDVVAKLRGVLKQKRVGHGGTLDPMATGVLPIFIGRATRAAEFCENAEKEYLAGLRLGIVTDTQDITGNKISENKINVTFDELDALKMRFTGAIKQIPPMYSAKKQDGRKLYELARRGVEVPRDAISIYISTLEILFESTGGRFMRPITPTDASGAVERFMRSAGCAHRTGKGKSIGTHEPDSCVHDFLCECEPCPCTYALRVTCSKGTYIRTLCHDIGSALGCGGVLCALRRIRAGSFTIDMAHTLDDVIAMSLTGSVSDILLPIDSIFSNHPQITLTESETKKAKNGAVCNPQEQIKNGTYRVYAANGEFLLLGEAVNNEIKTIKNFFEVQ